MKKAKRGVSVPAQQPFKSGKAKGPSGPLVHAGLTSHDAGEMHGGVHKPIKKF
jgi:hypothetical protein